MYDPTDDRYEEADQEKIETNKTRNQPQNSVENLENFNEILTDAVEVTDKVNVSLDQDKKKNKRFNRIVFPDQKPVARKATPGPKQGRWCKVLRLVLLVTKYTIVKRILLKTQILTIMRIKRI